MGRYPYFPMVVAVGGERHRVLDKHWHEEQLNLPQHFYAPTQANGHMGVYKALERLCAYMSISGIIDHF